MDQQIQDDGSPGHNEEKEGVTEFLLACDRCRRRKVKCSRGQPCEQCTTAAASCAYTLGLKSRVRKQRVTLANDIEKSVDHIARTVDELKIMVEDLSKQRPSPAQEAPTSSSKGVTIPSSSLLSSRHRPASVQTLGTSPASVPSVPPTEYNGESSPIAHVLFATAFFQNAVGKSSSFHVATEMAPVIQTLNSIANAQKQTNDPVDVLFPHARPLEDGRKPSSFPSPPLDSVFSCLKMAQESNKVDAMWLVEFESISHFTEYAIKACGPGPSSEEDIIIASAGLYWLFLECASVADDEATILDFEAQAALCRENLETALAHLGFHVKSTLDTAYALNMAATYCLQTMKTSAAWGFIATASHICHALGLHSATSISPEPPIQQRRKLRLFWVIYCSDRWIALRIGRSSSFRDNDITVPRPQRNPAPDSLINKLLPIWIDCGVLQGRIYDEVYSPGAFLQPEHVRVARARSLLSEIHGFMEAEDAIAKEHEAQLVATGQPLLIQVLWRSDRICNLSLLTLVYRSLPPVECSNSSFSEECISSCREALEEHQQCMALIESAGSKGAFIELFIGWSLLRSPFIPFTILFCHVIESSSASDLDALKRFIDASEASAYTARNAPTRNQLRLFQALYNVAVRFINLKQDSLSGEDAFPSANSHNLAGTSSGPATGTFVADVMDYSSAAPEIQGAVTAAATLQPGEDQLFANLGAQVDSSGGLLANWFLSNQEIMKMLENNFEVYNLIAFVDQAEMTSTVRPVFFINGAFAEYTLVPGMGPLQENGTSLEYHYWGDLHEQKLAWTAMDDAAAWTVEILLTDEGVRAGKGGYFKFYSGVNSPVELAKAYESLTGTQIKFVCDGMAEDLDKALDKAKKENGRGGFFQYLHLSWSKVALKGSWQIHDPVVLDHVKKPTTFEEHLKKRLGKE
ncbi:hypothetical protein CEP54_014167 [Fusarium duplospermum]|uniref:Zn(2)-C6 fungal-type domain-containing protein n=1 Tax=Fusarium duplospermum TaxID=1325734 RepID=A0A428NYA7_9HYPO|nr:hypothetical protein CEP54_014167 [Fusarium duplospermum]